MPRPKLVLAGATLVVLAACADEPGAATPPASDPSATDVAGTEQPDTEDLLVGVWDMVAMAEDVGGEREPNDGDFHASLVLREGGTGAYVLGSGPTPGLDALCDQPDDLTWVLSEDGTALEVVSGPDNELVWTIVALDEDTFSFEEGTDEFIHERLGSCR